MSVSIDVDQAIADNPCLRHLMNGLLLRAALPAGVKASPPVDIRYTQRRDGNTLVLLTHLGTSSRIRYNRADLKKVWERLPPKLALPADETLWPIRVITCIYNATGLPIGKDDFTISLLTPDPPNSNHYLSVVANEKCYGWYGELRIPVYISTDVGDFIERRTLGRLPINAPLETDIGRHLPKYNLGDLPPPA